VADAPVPNFPDTCPDSQAIRGGRPAPTGPRPQPSLPVWLPWLGAPGFLLLPMAGCGLADSLRHAPPPRSASVASDPTHQSPSHQPLAMTVVPIVPIGTAQR